MKSRLWPNPDQKKQAEKTFSGDHTSGSSSELTVVDDEREIEDTRTLYWYSIDQVQCVPGCMSTSPDSISLEREREGRAFSGEHISEEAVSVKRIGRIY